MMTEKESNELNNTVLEILDIFTKLSPEDKQNYFEIARKAKDGGNSRDLLKHTPDDK